MNVPGNHHTIMIYECPNCHGEKRMFGAPSKWGDGHPTDLGPCQVCGGSGELEQEFECRTLEDFEAEDEQRLDDIDINREAMTDFGTVR
jgi:hypothetical protein